MKVAFHNVKWTPSLLISLDSLFQHQTHTYTLYFALCKGWSYKWGFHKLEMVEFIVSEANVEYVAGVSL